MIKKMRVLLIDDHPLMAKGVASSIIEEGGNIDVIEAYSLREAATLIDPPPDLVITDLYLDTDGLEGVQTVQRVKAMVGDIDVIVFSNVKDYDTVQACLDAGASSYLVKELGWKPLKEEIEKFISFASVKEIALNKRQQQVLKQIRQGHSLKEIARNLEIGTATAKTYVDQLRDIVGLRTMREIAAISEEELNARLSH